MPIQPDGYMLLDDAITFPRIKKLKPTIADVFLVVAENNKKRLELKCVNKDWFIRATQGHTMKEVKDEELLEKITKEFGTYSVFGPKVL